MVTLPAPFIATKYPGYFWHPEEEMLYSMKVDGILKPLKFHMPNHFNHMYRYAPEGGFAISVKGHRKIYPLNKLRELVEHDATIPVKEKVDV